MKRFLSDKGRFQNPCRLVFILLFFLLIFQGPVKAQTTFPTYSSLQRNVNFWKSVYSEYASNQGILHDSENMNLIYDVIPLLRYDNPKQQKINRRRIKSAKKKYKAILRKLAKNGKGSNKKEREILALFGKNVTAAQLRRAEKQLRCQIGQKDRFRKGLIRSGAYIKRIKEVFRSYNLPEDLAYLPHVESSFNYKAYSKFGAAGIWQFTRSTGRRYMSVNYSVDERLDVMTATDSAARLLKENYKKLSSWPLAITAYNHGAAGMKRAKNRHGSYEKVYHHYKSRSFKFASKNFYSEFLAARHVAKNASKYFGNIRYHVPKDLKTVTVKGYASIKDLAAHFNVKITTIKKLNPALRRPVFKGQRFVPKGYVLNLPETLTGNLSIPSRLYKSGQRRSTYYIVRRGDTASTIARRHGVHLSELIQTNGLGRRGKIYVKQRLKIPSSARRSRPKKSAPVHTSHYTVKRGDTAAKIARKYGIKLSKLIRDNKLNKKGTIYVRQRLKINSAIKKSPPKKSNYYIVKRGDNAAKIARKHGISLAKLIKINNLNKKGRIYPKQRLRLKAPKKKPVVPSKMVAAKSESVKALPVKPEVKKAETTKTENTQKEKPTEEPKEKPVQLAKATPKIVTIPITADPAETKTIEKVSVDDEVKSIAEKTEAVGIEPAKEDPTITIASSTDAKEAEKETAVAIELPKPTMLSTEHLDIKVKQVTSKNKKPYGVIHVQTEETLGHYADWLQIKTWKLRRLNALSYGRSLKLHQKIKIPLGKISTEDFEEKRYEYHKKIEEDFFSAYKVESTVSYHVKSGDNAWKISNEIFQVPLWLIGRFNPNVNFNQLKKAQRILVPLVEKLS